MTVRTYRGDAPLVAKVCQISRPDGYVAGQVNIHINNKTVSWFEWDVDALVSAWNSALLAETQLAVASRLEPSESDSQYGTVTPSILLTAANPGEDFFVTVTIGDGSSTNEIQTLTFLPAPNGGTFTLSFDGQTTAAISYVNGDPSATAANILSALNALSNIAPGDVTVEAVSQLIYNVTFLVTYASTNVPLMTINYDSLLGGDVTVAVATVQEGVLPVDEVQTLSLPSAPTGGTFTLTYSGQTTAAIAYNANAATVQAALEALSNIGVGDVVCSGGALPGTPVIITFGTLLGDQDVALITGDGTSLTGGANNITAITTVRNGSAGTNQQQRYHYISTPGARTARWRCSSATGVTQYSAAFAVSVGNAAIKDALVGMSVFHYLGSDFNVGPYTDYTILTGDVSVTGDLTVAGGSGGIVVTYGGNLAQRDMSSIIALDDAVGGSSFMQNNGNGSPVVSPVQAFEQQRFTITDTTRSGTFALTVYDLVGGSHVTNPIAYSLDYISIAGEINLALGGNFVALKVISVTGASVTYEVQYLNYGYQIVNITVLSSSEGSVQVVESIKGTAGTREIQSFAAAYSVAIRAGTFTVTYDGQTTSALDYDTTAAELLTALEALSNIAVGDLQVTGGPIDEAPFVLSWKPQLGDVELVSVTSSLVNSAALLVEYITGGISIFVEEIIRNAGPECFDDPLNFSPEGIPTEDDDIVFEFGKSHCRWGIKQRDVFSVHNVSTNTLKCSTSRWLFQDGQRLRVKSTGTAPGGLSSGTSYYVINSDGVGRFQLSTTLGGSAIDITDIGSGVHTIGLMLNSVTKPARYSFDIGLSRNNNGFVEFRPRYLEVWIDEHITLGERDGTDSGLQRYDLGDTTIVNGILIYGTAAATEESAPAVGILLQSSATDLKAYSGDVGFAPFLDETSQVRDVETYDTRLSSVGVTTCRNLKLDKDSTIVGNFTPSGTLEFGI